MGRGYFFHLLFYCMPRYSVILDLDRKCLYTLMLFFFSVHVSYCYHLQISRIYTDNLCLLCLSCNSKMFKNNCQNLLKKAEASVVLIVFKGVPLSQFCNHFLLFALRQSDTRRLLLRN